MNTFKFASLVALSAAIGTVSAYAQDKAPEQPGPAVVAAEKAPEQPSPAVKAAEKAPEQPTPAVVAAEKAPEQPAPAVKAAEKAPEQPTPAVTATEKTPEQPSPVVKAPEQPSPVVKAAEKAPTPVQPSPAVVAYAKEFVAKWSSDAKLIEAIKASTAKHGRFSFDEVQILDNQWRVAKSGVEKEKRAAEVLKELAPGKSIDDHIKEGQALIQAARGSEASKFLAEQLDKAEPKGAITEVFVMDGWGWNVGQTGGTSDYYQADEGKWQKTFAAADPNEIEILEIVEEEGISSSQISLPIKENGKNVGAVTVGVDVNIVK